MKPAIKRYNAASVMCHWLGAILMFVALLSGEVRHFVVEAGHVTMYSMMVLHIGTGMAILFLMLPRILSRVIGPQPAAVSNGSTLTDFAAKAVHLMLYVFLITEPLIGWLIVNAKGMRVPMPLLGFEFPALVARNAELVALLVPTHDFIARVFYLVIAAHIGAALWHHVVKKDGTLRRMSFSALSSHKTHA
ncbi:cytochrome b [Trinickia mobilis]|uniref:cytochrome b n=1 Tax=Trinickia mobilis TaxID=2816356 RepID=UPI001A8E0C92|nr:cytochrome b [Trinickia mobilis]